MSEYITHKDKKILQLIKKYSGDNPLKILDVGAGDKPLKNFFPENIKYFSLDIDSKRNPNIAANLEEKLPIKNREYDFIIASEVLEHTLYPKNIIRELKRITKNGGFIIMSLPNEYNFYLRLKFFLGIQNNTEIPFRENLYKNHIHKARVEDILKFYRENLDVLEIRYSWDSFSNKKVLQKIDKFIHSLLSPLSRNLFSRSVIVIGKKR